MNGTARIDAPVVRIRCDRRVMVDPAPVIAHMEFLQGVGMSRFMIQRAAGTNARAIASLYQYGAVAKTTADALLTVTPRPMKHQAKVLAFGAHRRIEALLFAGHPLERIAVVMGKELSFVWQVHRRTYITWETHAAVDVAFRKLLWDTGQSTRTKRAARRGRYVPALVWNDIDDLFEEPDLSVVLEYQRRVRGRPRGGGDERAELVAELTVAGRSAAEIAVRLGVSARQVQRDRARMRDAA